MQENKKVLLFPLTDFWICCKIVDCIKMGYLLTETRIIAQEEGVFNSFFKEVSQSRGVRKY